MTTLSNRLKMVLMDNTDNVDVVAQLDTNTGILDETVPNFVCTALSRPATPFDGMPIYETDTGYERIWVTAVGRWVATNQKMVLSTDSRPNNALLGDRLFETDTGITRVWDGVRFKPMGEGNIYFQENSGGNFGVVAHPDWSLNIANFTFTADSHTPYDFEAGIAGWYMNAIGGSQDQLETSIQYNVNGGAFTDIQFAVNALDATAGAIVGNGFYIKRRITPAAGTITVKVNSVCTRGTAANANIFNSAASHSFLRVTER